MRVPQFKGENLVIANEKPISFYELRKNSKRATSALYFFQTILCLGFLLILLNNFDVLSPGNYFGVFSWVTATVFGIGLIINYISIPYLYFSSFQNFKKENDSWDREVFWILPLFFFGTYYLYGSNIFDAMVLLIISLVMILGIHLHFMSSAWKNMIKESNCSLPGKQQYFVTLKYLSAYYVLLLALLVIFNPLQKLVVWITLHI